MSFREYWSLDPDVVFLNHGSFGACPIAVQREQTRLREQMERKPVEFLSRLLESKLDEVRDVLAEFLGSDADDLALVSNATAGVNSVVRSLPFSQGDEILTTDHAYNACRNVLEQVAVTSGARVVTAAVPLPLESGDQIVDAVMAHVTERTRLALLDHVTSPTGLVLPIERLVKALAARGVDTLVDGAHAPGMVPIALGSLGATYYAGNCHKWLCAPKGAGFLYVCRDRQPLIRPPVISHGARSPRTDRSRFRLEFDWMGTVDPTPWLCVPIAIRFLGGLLPGGWEELRAHNRSLALDARAVLCERLGVSPPSPDEIVGSLAAVPIPHGDSASLERHLYDNFGIEVPIIVWPHAPNRLVRISAQIYNTPDEYTRLADALAQVLS